MWSAIEFISGNPLDGNCIKFLSELKLFQERKSGKYVSTNQVSCLAEIERIPVQYHKESLLENRHTCVYLCGQQLLLVTFVKLLYSAAAGRYIICHLIHQFQDLISTETSYLMNITISGNPLDGNCIKFLSELKLFQEKKSGKYVSTNQVSCLAEIERIPVQYHKESLLCPDTSHKNLANYYIQLLQVGT
jgi:hypothetical protein